VTFYLVPTQYALKKINPLEKGLNYQIIITLFGNNKLIGIYVPFLSERISRDMIFYAYIKATELFIPKEILLFRG